ATAPHRAAELLLRGDDPYRTFDLPQALAEFGLDPQLVTHYADGSVMHVYNYPALSFLVVAPFVASGLGDIRWIYLAELVALVLVVRGTVREPWRPLVVAPVIAGCTVLGRRGLPADGVGLVRFALAGPLPHLPRAVWSAASAVSLVALVVVFWRYRRSSPQAGPVFAVVPLYLAWRSLQNYFAFTPLLLAASDADVRARDRLSVASERSPS